MRRRLTEQEKIYIVKYYDLKSIGKISEDINRSRSTVQTFYDRYLKRKTIMNKKPGDKKRKIRENS